MPRRYVSATTTWSKCFRCHTCAKNPQPSGEDCDCIVFDSCLLTAWSGCPCLSTRTIPLINRDLRFPKSRKYFCNASQRVNPKRSQLLCMQSTMSVTNMESAIPVLRGYNAMAVSPSPLAGNMACFYLLQFIRMFASHRVSKHALDLIQSLIELRRFWDAFWTVL